MKKAAIRGHATHVSGSMNPHVGGIRVRPKLFVCELRPPPVTAGKITAPNGDFANLALSRFFTRFTDYNDLAILHGITGRNNIACKLSLMVDKELGNISRFRARHQNFENAMATENFSVQVHVSTVNHFSAAGD